MVDLVGIDNVFHGMGILQFTIGIGLVSGPPLSGKTAD